MQHVFLASRPLKTKLKFFKKNKKKTIFINHLKIKVKNLEFSSDLRTLVR